jgi:hypothetical protein
MKQTTVAELAAALARLERTNRRWRQLVTLGLLGLSFVVLTAQASPAPSLLEAEQFVIRDVSGRVRLAIKPLDGGAVVLTFRDELERDRLAVGLLGDGSPILSFYDEHRRRRLAVLGPESPGLLVFGRDGTTRASLAMHTDDSPALELSGKDSTVRARLGLDEGDRARLSILDAQGEPLLQLPGVTP